MRARIQRKKKGFDQERVIQTKTDRDGFSSPSFEAEERKTQTKSSPADLQRQRAQLGKGFNLLNVPLYPPQNTSPPIQRNMTVGEPGDKYEREADQMAEKVVQSLNQPTSETGNGDQGVQKQEEELSHRQTSPIQAYIKPSVQRNKYVINQPVGGGFKIQPKKQVKGIDPFRNPSPMVQLMREKFLQKHQYTEWKPQGMKPDSIQRNEEEEDKLAMKPDSIQRNEMEEDDTIQGNGLKGGTVTPEFETQLQQAKSGGQPLQPELQTKMGAAMGADFSGVKVHTDAQSDQLNKSIQAKAFTTGQDVFFKQGEYNPSSRVGQQLIAHELTHVVQQNGSEIKQQSSTNSSVQAKTLSNESQILRKQGDQNTSQYKTGQSLIQKAPIQTMQTIGQPVIQRKWVEDGNEFYWDKLQGPFRWYFDPAIHKFYYEIQGSVQKIQGSDDKVEELYKLYNKYAITPRTSEEWSSIHRYGERVNEDMKWAQIDPSFVEYSKLSPFIPIKIIKGKNKEDAPSQDAKMLEVVTDSKFTTALSHAIKLGAQGDDTRPKGIWAKDNDGKTQWQEFVKIAKTLERDDNKNIYDIDFNKPENVLTLDKLHKKYLEGTENKENRNRGFAGKSKQILKGFGKKVGKLGKGLVTRTVIGPITSITDTVLDIIKNFKILFGKNEKKNQQTGWDKFYEKFKAFQGLVGGISKLAGVLALITGVLGLVPSLQPLLAVSVICGTIAMYGNLVGAFLSTLDTIFTFVNGIVKGQGAKVILKNTAKASLGIIKGFAAFLSFGLLNAEFTPDFSFEDIPSVKGISDSKALETQYGKRGKAMENAFDETTSQAELKGSGLRTAERTSRNLWGSLIADAQAWIGKDKVDRAKELQKKLKLAPVAILGNTAATDAIDKKQEQLKDAPENTELIEDVQQDIDIVEDKEEKRSDAGAVVKGVSSITSETLQEIDAWLGRKAS